VKTLIFVADGKAVAVLIRGDEEVNEAKLRNYLGATPWTWPRHDIVLAATELPKGTLPGAIGQGSRVWPTIRSWNRVNVVMGPNREDYHVRMPTWGRLCREGLCGSQIIKESDSCPAAESRPLCPRDRSGARLQAGHEVTARPMKATSWTRDGKEKFMIMGCYGIGVGAPWGRHRTAARRQGILWPMTIAPFHVTHHPRERQGREHCEDGGELYRELEAAGLEVLLDDRDERPGEIQ